MTSPTPHLINALEALDEPAAADGPVYRYPAEGEQPTHQKVTLTDGTEFVVKTGNRDLIAWDRSSASKRYPRDANVFIFVNFLAFNAATRAGEFGGTFDGPGGWLDVAEDITPLVKVDDEPGPTRPAAR